jgi:hypothetical protein
MDESKPDPLNSLNEEERKAYDHFKLKRAPEIGATLGARLFELYCMGRSCLEIHRMNPALSLGAIVDARVRYYWDDNRTEHTKRLMLEASSRVLDSQLSCISFLSDLLAVTHMEQRLKIAAYLTGGSKKDLEGVIPIDSMNAYARLITTLTELADKKPDATPVPQTHQHMHVHTGPVTDLPPAIETTATKFTAPQLEERVLATSNFLQEAAAEQAVNDRLRRERAQARKTTGKQDDLDSEG